MSKSSSIYIRMDVHKEFARHRDGGSARPG
jgi:hypothetical protein